jgi:cyclophilin family peptidyl-prolyl cis-trans isomerase
MSMRRLAAQMWNALRRRDPKASRRPARRLLNVEALEVRAVPTANVAPALTGTAFIDRNGNGIFNAGDTPLAGVGVTLVGRTFKGSAIDVSTATRANGTFQFLNVPTGTYELVTAPVTGFGGATVTLGSVHGAAGASFVAGVPVAPGKNLSASISFRGQTSPFISLAQFLSSTPASGLPVGRPGPGSAAATGPFVKTAIGATTLNATTSTRTIDLAGHFSAPDITNSVVRFDVEAGGVKGRITLELFDNAAPQTVTNFLDYVTNHRYDQSIIHRITTQANNGGIAVVQGGGFTPPTDPTAADLPPIVNNASDPKIADEVGIANAPGTISMALSGPDTAQAQFFFNVSDNTQSLGAGNGASTGTHGFTVFGKAADATSLNLINQLAKLTTKDESAVDGAFKNIPLINYTGTNFPKDTTLKGTTPSNYVLIKDAIVVSRNEVLTYTATSSDPSVATVAAFDPNHPEQLKLDRVKAGTVTITVTAHDQFGTTASTSFKVTVS